LKNKVIVKPEKKNSQNLCANRIGELGPVDLAACVIPRALGL
jgi:hypothetical protein